MSNDNLGVLSILSTAYDRRKETVNGYSLLVI